MPPLFNTQDFDDRFRENLDGRRVNPPARVWSRIARELDKKPFYKRFSFWAAACSLCLLFSMGTFYFIHHHNDLEHKTINSIPARYSADETPGIRPGSGNPDMSRSSATNKNSGPAASNQVGSYNAPQSTTPAGLQAFADQPGTAPVELSVWSIHSGVSLLFPQAVAGGPSRPYPIGKAVVAVIPEATPPPFRVPAPLSLKGFFVGTQLQVTNIWLYDKLSAAGLSNVQYIPDFGLSFGFSAGYNFSNHFGLQTDILVQRAAGQDYVYRESFMRTTTPAAASLVHKNFSLDYFSTPVYLSFKMGRRSAITRQPVAYSLLAGLQYSRLKSASESEEDVMQRADYLFKKNDLGIAAGLDYSLFTKSKTSFDIGLRASYGLTQVWDPTSDYTKYEQLANPHNLSFGIRTGINFSL